MAFSLGSRLTANLPLSEYLAGIATCFRWVEIPTDPRFLSPYFPLNANSKITLRAYGTQYHFRYSMHAPFVNLGSLDREERLLAIHKFQSAMQVAAELEVSLLTFHPANVRPETVAAFDEICRLETESISLLLDTARQLGVSLLIENMPSAPEFHPTASNGERIRELLAIFTGSEFGVTIDIGHALQAQADIDALLGLERVRHFHLHENDRLSDRHLRIITHLDWWKQLLQKLNERFPQAVGILEMNQLVDQLESFERLHPLLSRD
ncbi:sugar phosphate isomerase/epimerase [Hydrogenispora ethanolica]|uniref:Sugar phosphate isomerase/epimerase n=1 Tax=Hydrogenispora ethanolica TaxID=1082276 RepID=A0A4V2QDL8_HYDET|nr:sugar phosphate isomerase/epimerase family protein [Hydrogenispora ethanolica]TCL64277.1 sugar phosphate isomerase/epimerase [Hydrogenispora ethanolica]